MRKPKSINAEALADAKPGVYRLLQPLQAFKGAFSGTRRPTLVLLEIPRGAIVVKPRGGAMKMRASSALVLKMWRYLGSYDVRPPRKVLKAYSWHDHTFEYDVGLVMRARPKLDRHVGASCTAGIHFYLGVRDALGWVHNLEHDAKLPKGLK